MKRLRQEIVVRQVKSLIIGQTDSEFSIIVKYNAVYCLVQRMWAVQVNIRQVHEKCWIYNEMSCIMLNLINTFTFGINNSNISVTPLLPWYNTWCKMTYRYQHWIAPDDMAPFKRINTDWHQLAIKPTTLV